MKGNKGEWSEAYAFLKLLADGRLHAADSELNPITEIYYPILRIIRKEADKQREYVLNGTIRVIDGATNETLLELPVIDFVRESKKLFDVLIKSEGRSFSIEKSEAFLRSIDVDSLTASTNDKSDIRLVVYDLNTGMSPTLGFSIKSLLGQKSTLFNAGAGTNFVFLLQKPPELAFNVEEFNRETLVPSKLSTRLQKLEGLGFRIIFKRTQSENLQFNLQLIDSRLPELLGEMIWSRFKTGVSNVADLLKLMIEENPLKFGLGRGHPFYQYKLKSFLVDSALGMTAETVWTGSMMQPGGIIIVKGSGELVCYHIYNRNEFENYLLNNTRLEQPSTSEDECNPGHAVAGSKAKPYKYGWVYEEDGELYIKLNLQVRFK